MDTGRERRLRQCKGADVGAAQPSPPLAARADRARERGPVSAGPPFGHSDLPSDIARPPDRPLDRASHSTVGISGSASARGCSATALAAASTGFRTTSGNYGHHRPLRRCPMD